MAAYIHRSLLATDLAVFEQGKTGLCPSWLKCALRKVDDVSSASADSRTSLSRKDILRTYGRGAFAVLDLALRVATIT
jgi:hypothetical protein